jgi:hypothetical protein
MMGDPVVKVARHTAAAFRLKDLGPIADMIDYLADAADKQWDADSKSLAGSTYHFTGEDRWRVMASRLACALEAVLDVDPDDGPDQRKLDEADAVLNARIALINELDGDG